MSNAVLKFENVVKSYNPGAPNEVSVLNGADLTLSAGEIVGLIAPSGAGKSTLLHLAGLLDVADAGTIAIDQQSVVGMRDGQKTRIRREIIGFIYQFHHLLPEFSAEENIVLPQLAHGVSRPQAVERAQGLLASVGLRDRASHRPTELSGGEQQRVAFCRALANRPKLLLADEPTGNLDPETSEKVFDALLDLVRNEGLAALVATHNHELARRMDRVVRLDSGKILSA